MTLVRNGSSSHGACTLSIRTKAARVLVFLVVATLAIPASRLSAQTSGSAPTPAMCLASVSTAAVYAAGERCIPTWIDSLQSGMPGTSSVARYALMLTGGRTAVDALRSDYVRSPNRASRLAVIGAMATTGSREDIAFLSTQLQGQPHDPNDWPGIEAAAVTLGLLRATAARDSLTAALGRNGQNSFSGRAIAAALTSLDRPPCADSIVGDTTQALIRIVMQCGPESMSTRARYLTEASGVWSFTGGVWRLGAGAPADSGVKTRVSTTATIEPDGRHAEVRVLTSCGRLCGEGWTYRLMFIGGTWRVVAAVMNWVS